MWKINLRKDSSNRFAKPNVAPLWGMPSLMLRSFNEQVSGSGFQLSPKSPSAPSDTRRMLLEIVSLPIQGYLIFEWKIFEVKEDEASN